MLYAVYLPFVSALIIPCFFRCLICQLIVGAETPIFLARVSWVIWPLLRIFDIILLWLSFFSAASATFSFSPYVLSFKKIMDHPACFVGYHLVLFLQHHQVMPQRSPVYVSLVCDVAVMHAWILPDIIIYF